MAKKLPPRLGDIDGNYHVFFSEKGRSRKQSLWTKNLLEAQARFSGWLEARNNDLVYSDDPKFKFCVEHHYKQEVIPHFVTAERYVSLNKNLNLYFGEKYLTEITREDGKTYTKLRLAGKIGNCKAASGTCRRELQHFRAIIKFMMERVEPKELRIDNKIKPHIDLPPKSPAKDIVFSVEELDRICKWQFNRVDRFVWLARYTAARKDVLLNLKKEQINWERSLIDLQPIGKRTSKQKRNPKIPIDPKLHDYLVECFRIDEKPRDIFYRNQKIGSEKSEYVLGDFPKNIDGDLKRLLMECQIHEGSAHTFRHSWATHKISNGISIEKVAKFMGDTEKTVRENYEHLSPDYLRDVF